MHRIVLGASPQFAILSVLRTLQTFHHLCSHDTGQIRIFTIGFLSPTPTGVAENVHVRRPYREAVELFVLTTAPLHTLIVLCTKLGRGHVETFVEQVGIKRCCHCHRFREHGDIALVCSTVQRLTPPEELFNA